MAILEIERPAVEHHHPLGPGNRIDMDRQMFSKPEKGLQSQLRRTILPFGD